MKHPIRASIAISALTLAAAMPGSAAAATTVSPTSLTFSQQVGGTSASQAVTLTKDCSGADAGFCMAMIPVFFAPQISVSPPVFKQTNNCPASLVVTTVPASCTINVSFTPSAQGSVSGTLSTGMGGPTAALSGTGLLATPATPAAPPPGKKCKKGKKKKKGASAAKKCKKKKKRGN